MNSSMLDRLNKFIAKVEGMTADELVDDFVSVTGAEYSSLGVEYGQTIELSDIYISKPDIRFFALNYFIVHPVCAPGLAAADEYSSNDDEYEAALCA